MPVLAILLLLAGCTVQVDPLAVEDVFDLGANPSVDVLFVVDDSNSMASIQAGLADSWTALTAPLAAVDWQIGVTTTDFDDPSKRGRIRRQGGGVLRPGDPDPGQRFAASVEAGVDGSTVERGLQAGWAAVTPPLATHENLGLIRPEARLVVVFVSDEDDCSDEGALGVAPATDCQARPDLLVSPAAWAARFTSLKADPADVLLEAMVDVADPLTGCGGGNPGTRYIEAARRSGGGVLPPCGDFGASMTRLGEEAAGLRRGYPLSRAADPATITVEIESADGGTTEVQQEAGWSYDPAIDALRLGDAVPLAQGDVVRIRYAIPVP